MSNQFEKSAAEPERNFHSVSVIIPTVNRPDELHRAVISALAQSLPPLEVIVVVDGELEQSKLGRVPSLNDGRVKIHATGSPSGDAGSSARNLGVARATGTFVAFLDDDDEWLPDKLRLQIDAVRSANSPLRTVVSGRAERRSREGSSVWPTRVKKPDESVAAYLFVRSHAGEGWLPTPTLLTSRSLAVEIPFATGLRNHEDYDWMLRAESVGAEFIVLDHVIATVHVLTGESASKNARWKDSLTWARDRRQLLGSAAFSGFCLSEVARHGRQDHKFATYATILKNAVAGKPRARDIAKFTLLWIMPLSLIERVRAKRNFSQ